MAFQLFFKMMKKVGQWCNLLHTECRLMHEKQPVAM